MAGYRPYIARRPGRCRQCRGQIAPGETGAYIADAGSFHLTCVVDYYRARRAERERASAERAAREAAWRAAWAPGGAQYVKYFGDGD
jgi:hypothetical protein